MKNFYLIFFLIFTMYCQAQYYTAKLFMTDGSVKEGFAQLPSNKLLDTKVEFKKTHNGSVEKIDDDDVDKILITSNEGVQFIFERNHVVHLQKIWGKEVVNEKKNKQWMIVIYINSALKVYSLSQRYKIDKRGVMISITGAHSIWEFIYFLYKKPDEDKASIVSGIPFTKAQTRQALSVYFKEYPDFLKRIENKEFKNKSIENVADEFDDYYNK